MTHKELKLYLDKKVDFYNRPSFIEHDPISIPHRFSIKQDIEISGLFAALFAWGNRTTIINKANDLMARMENAPYDFIKNHKPKDLTSILGFKHRTFMDGDILFLIEFLHQHYKKFESLERAFLVDKISVRNLPSSIVRKGQGLRQAQPDDSINQENHLGNFYNYVFSFPHLKRTEKHISTPAKNSACKRINMYLRWMVRQDAQAVDFGLWKILQPKDLMIPLDVHVCRVAYSLGLMENKKSNWKETVKLTEHLRLFDAADPIKYDFALFSMGVAQKF